MTGPSPSSNFGFFHWPARLAGILRSSHALIGLLATLSFGFVFVPGLSVYAFGLFTVIVLAVLFRYMTKGPEADRALSTLAISDVRIMNVDFSMMQRPEFQRFMSTLMSLRQPLPAPAGIVKGSASDPASIQEITPEEAEKLREQDNV